MIQGDTGSILTIDLGALAANWRLLRDRVAPAECAAVVKADAYGIGIDRAVPAFAAAGCRTFFVAHLGEARRVRAAAPEAVIYVLNGLLPGAAPDFVAAGARPILGSAPELAEWAVASAQAGRRLPAALHVDTGMNRLGFAPVDVPALAADPRLGAIGPALLMSHLATADEADAPLTARQLDAFAALRPRLAGIPASLANSSGIFLPERPFYDLARPGYALYGGNPTPGRPNPMRPVVRLEVPVIQVRSVAAGDPVGYGAQWRATRPSRLATLSLGYADGFSRAAGAANEGAAPALPGGAALVAGRLCPFAGRVSMDLIVLDVTDVPEAGCRRGTMTTLIGDELDLDEVGRRAGTIGYEVLTSLGHRYERRYREAA